MSATTQTSMNFRQQSARPKRAAAARPGLPARIAGTLRLWRRRMRWRQELWQLSYRDIRDMGVTPSDVAWEASQPFWREAPPR